MLFGRDFIPAVLALVLSATGAEAAIAIGVVGNTNAMWIEGETTCNARFLTNSGSNPCGITVTLSNGNRYSLQGCGGRLWINNGDGSFNSNCNAANFSFTGCNSQVWQRTFVCG